MDTHSRKQRRNAFTFAAAALTTVAGQAMAASDTVTVAQGALHGSVSGTVVSFKNIPYAAPPVGALRWRPPAPAASWRGTRDATAFGPACIQFGTNIPALTNGQSEDCLSLNVWMPADAKPNANLPVMLWIYGGGFQTGAAAIPMYDGTKLAERGVVVVSINYRVGRLGFFAHPALTAEKPGEPIANYGFMDCLAGLKWVQSNIAAFGGAPKNVTVFGESAGGEMVNLLMSSPAANGLFARAIAESGFGRLKAIPATGNGATTGEKGGLAFAAAGGIKGSGPDALKALRALSTDQLQKIDLAALKSTDASSRGSNRPMIDGKVIAETPEQAFAKGHEQKVPYIAGGNSFEASVSQKQVDAAPDKILERTGKYRAGFVAAYGNQDVLNTAYDLTTESGVIEPDRYLAREHTKNGQKAWVYYASYLPVGLRGQVHGLNHGGEIRYVFGTLSDTPTTRNGRTIPAATAEDWDLSKKFASYWVAFAKTSDPGKAGGTQWPLFNLKNDTLLEFGVDGIKPRDQFHKVTLDPLEQLADSGVSVRGN